MVDKAEADSSSRSDTRDWVRVHYVLNSKSGYLGKEED